MSDPNLVLTEQAHTLLTSIMDGAQEIEERNVEERRHRARELHLARCGDPEQVASVEKLHANNVPARLYRPVGDERHVLVWFHGGAWMFGDLDCCDAVVRALANRTRCAVLSVDYRLAPEHRYPAAIDDCWAATAWAAERFDGVAVGGDSAGGNLAAAAALRARDRGVELALQLLVYPVLDFAAVDSAFYNDYRERYEGFGGVKGFGSRGQGNMRAIWEIYVPEPSRRGEPDASPLQARSLAGIAPALLITAEHDILRGEGEDYARRLRAHGVPVDLVNYERQIHGFFAMLGVMDDAHDAVERSARALRQAWKQV